MIYNPPTYLHTTYTPFHKARSRFSSLESKTALDVAHVTVLHIFQSDNGRESANQLINDLLSASCIASVINKYSVSK